MSESIESSGVRKPRERKTRKRVPYKETVNFVYVFCVCVRERERERERELMMMMVGMGVGLSNMRYRDVLFSLLVVLGGPLLYFTLWRGVILGMWWQTRRTRRIFEAQGVKCLPRPFLYGNLPEFVALNAKARSQPMPEISHDVAPRVFPHLYKWSNIYGERFVYWFGSQARFLLTEPEQAKELLSNKAGHFKKPAGRPDGTNLLGMGLATLEGEKWAQHRRIISPSFFLDKLKGMAPTMVACTEAMMQTWEARVERKEAIDVSVEFRELTADIIAHTAFGSSFAEGKQVFEMQCEQQVLVSKSSTTLYIPGSRFLPTAQNRYRTKLNKRVNEVLRQLIQKRMESCEIGRGDLYCNDLLGLMLAANKGELHGNQRNLSMGIDELIDECKTFFFAGHETTATLLTFMFLLLGSNPEWQERLREEVYEVCGKTELPTSESLNNLKLVGMAINETLRLYPPAVVVFRQAESDMKLGTITIPAKAVMIVPIIAWHHDERYWGPDANEFRPERFKEGVAKACKVAGAYLPFSIGPRNCIGQLFATIEAKMVLSTILQRYRFRLSPQYIHAPTMLLTMRPQFGMPIVFEKLP